MDHMFSGQLSTMYLFSEAFSSAQISSIYELGPSYKVIYCHEGDADHMFSGQLSTMYLFSEALSSADCSDILCHAFMSAL